MQKSRSAGPSPPPLCFVRRKRLEAVSWNLQKAVNTFFDVVLSPSGRTTPAPAPAPVRLPCMLFFSQCQTEYMVQGRPRHYFARCLSQSPVSPEQAQKIQQLGSFVSGTEKDCRYDSQRARYILLLYIAPFFSSKTNIVERLPITGVLCPS